MKLNDLYVSLMVLVGAGLLGLLLFIWTRRLTIPAAYNQLISSVRDGVVILNREARIIDLNPVAKRLLHSDQTPLLNQLLSSVLTLPPSVPLSGDGHAMLEHLVGDTLCEVSSTPLMNRRRVIGRILVLRDITARKQAEREALDLLLERERARILTLFIRDASHEFRTPVTVMRTSLHLLARQPDADKRAKHISTIETQIDRLARLIEDLQKMSVLERTHELRRDAKDIYVFLYEVWRKFEAQTTDHPVNLVLGTERLICEFDARELQHALIRVLENATRYSPPGSPIELSAMRDGDDVCISVEDHGIGMDADALRQATQRFYRSDEAHSTSGFGLGLPIAKTIIELHGGSLKLSSVQGQGTTVTFRLPVSR